MNAFDLKMCDVYFRKNEETPKAELDRAKEYRDDYLERCDYYEEV